jgi:hypothetical protein
MAISETHEPAEPINWPDGHVDAVRSPGGTGSGERLTMGDVGVEITDAAADECMVVSIGDYRHYLHSTTTRALRDKLVDVRGQAAVVTIHGISHTMPSRVVSVLSSALQRRLTEWNATARANGVQPV